MSAVHEQADHCLRAYQQSLDRKRDAAFRADEHRQMQAAYQEMTETYPQWTNTTPPTGWIYRARQAAAEGKPIPRYAPPIRSNQPQAGDAGYEPYSPAPRVDWPHLRFCLGVGLFCVGVWLGVIWMAWKAATG
jgi:hypothetical protein